MTHDPASPSSPPRRSFRRGVILLCFCPPLLLLWIPTGLAPFPMPLLLGAPCLLTASFGLWAMERSLRAREQPWWAYALLSPLVLVAVAAFVYGVAVTWTSIKRDWKRQGIDQPLRLPPSRPQAP